MNTTVTVSLANLGLLLKQKAEKLAPAIEEGTMISAARIWSSLKRLSPVFDGHFKNAWRPPRRVGKNTIVENDAPYAGIIESGSRPHKVNSEGIYSLTKWAEKKLSAGEDAEKIAWAIAKTIEEKGQEGKFLVRDNIPVFVRWLQDEIERRLAIWATK